MSQAKQALQGGKNGSGEDQGQHPLNGPHLLVQTGNIFPNFIF